MKSPDLSTILAERNFVVVGSTPGELAHVMDRGLEGYRKVIREADIKPD